jgi:hypothetical protein
MALLMRTEVNSSYVGVILPAFVVLGTGMAMTMSPMTAAVMASVPVARAGVASAATNTSRELGGVLGIAVLGAVVTSAFKRAFEANLLGAGFPHQAVGAIVGGAGQSAAAGRLTVQTVLQQAPPGTSHQTAVTVVNAVHESFTHAIHIGMIVAVGLALFASLVSLLFVRSHVGAEHPEAVPA